MKPMRVWSLLVGITLVEVALAWVQMAPAFMLALLLLLSLAKAGLIAWYFMHLGAIRTMALRLLLPMLFVCVGLLLVLLPDGMRAGALR